jgi:uroporphyrinogen decarboxylase
MGITKKERVLCALNHEQPDRTPTDFQATPEIWQRLFERFGVSEIMDVLDRLDIDCAWVDPEVKRLPTAVGEDGFADSWGGSKVRMVENEYGSYAEVVKYATDGCTTISEMEKALKLPDLDGYDFSAVVKTCTDNGDRFLLGGFASIFYYPSLVRRLEDLLLDMALNEPLAKYLLGRCFDWHMDYHKRLLEAGAGRIDAMQLADDFSTQIDIMISIDMFRHYFREPMSEYIALAKSYGATPYLHCCGSAYRLIPEFIDLGIKILDPIQTVARNMEPERLKAEFGDRMTFHGAGETQKVLPRGTADEVRQNARMLSKTLGKNGGYIMSSCHNLQPDVPIENVLAFYETENRG